MEDIQDLIIALEAFRIHLPLHTRDESKAIVDRVIVVLIEIEHLEADNKRLKEEIEAYGKMPASVTCPQCLMVIKVV